MTPTIPKLKKIMKFLKKDTVVIPHYSLTLQQETSGFNYRQNKTFRFFNNGTLIYNGWEWAKDNDRSGVEIRGIRPTEEWIVRAYDIVEVEAIEKARRITKGSQVK